MRSSIKASDIFVCQKCGNCCKGYGGTYITNEDIKNIAEYIKISPERFVSEYCLKSGGRLILAQKENSYCIFWDQICTIHPVKPRMCKQWPFIKSVLTDIDNWRIMAASCPGIRTDFSDDVILACVKEEIEKNYS